MRRHKLYYCLNCHSLFTYPKLYVEKHGLDSPPYEEIDVCPYCHCSDIVETHNCDVCDNPITGNYVRLSNGMYICDNCYSSENVGG